jgi:vacuolar protein sorting-associated protein VTA1
MVPPTLPLTLIPQSIRSVAHYVKICNEHADRDIVVYYWCLFKAVEDAMTTDSTSPEAKKFLTVAMNILEQVKKENKDNDAIMQEVVAQSHIEDQAQRLFTYANSQDDSGQFNNKMMKAFYTCGYLFDVLCMFGTLDENIQSARKYSKWRATYIFGCLKRGEQPIPGKHMSNKDGLL